MVRTSFVPIFFSWTFAPTTAAPLGSVTAPAIEDVNVWPNDNWQNAKATIMATKKLHGAARLVAGLVTWNKRTTPPSRTLLLDTIADWRETFKNFHEFDERSHGAPLRVFLQQVLGFGRMRFQLRGQFAQHRDFGIVGQYARSFIEEANCVGRAAFFEQQQRDLAV